MPVTKIVSEYAEGDGNCAFNAFILGLSDARVLDHLSLIGEADPNKRYELFIKVAQTVFTGTSLNWQKLRDSLIRYKANDRVRLQKALAPVMRAFAIELIKKDQESYYKSTINPLKVELENYFAIMRQWVDAFALESLNVDLKNYFKIMQKRAGNPSLANIPVDNTTPGMEEILRLQYVKETFQLLWNTHEKQKDGLAKAQAALQLNWKERSESNPLKAAAEIFYMIKYEQANVALPLHSPIDEETPGMGDIFIRHQFVKDAFAFLWTNYSKLKGGLDLAKAALEAKWQAKGIDLFLTSMSSASVYAGDLELAPLAKYFGVNLDVDMGVRGHHSIVRISRLPESVRLADESEFKLDRPVCLKLSTRGIIDVERELEKISPEEVDARLGKIPEYDKVVAYINTNKPVKGAPVPEDWSPACLQQLLQRSIITRSKVFASDLSDAPVDKRINGKENREETLKRIDMFPNAAEIAAAWKAVPSAPMMTLQNRHAAHWNNIATLVIPDPKPSDGKSDSANDADKNAANASASNNTGNDSKTVTVVEIPDLRSIATLQFLGGKIAPSSIKDILAARKILDQHHGDAKDASDTLFAYYKVVDAPKDAKELLHFAVRYHTLVGLYEWSGYSTVNTKYVADFRESLRAQLSTLAKNFPAEFAVLSDHDDWEKFIKPCLDPRRAEKVLTQKLDRLEKIFKQDDDEKMLAAITQMHPCYVAVFNQLRYPQLSAGAFTRKLDHLEKVFKHYDEKKWQAAVAVTHPSFVAAFYKLRYPKLSAEINGSAYSSPWHLWAPSRDEVKSNKPMMEQELLAPKYIR